MERGAARLARGAADHVVHERPRRGGEADERDVALLLLDLRWSSGGQVRLRRVRSSARQCARIVIFSGYLRACVCAMRAGQRRGPSG